MSKTRDLIPRKPRRMHQPSKDVLREQLVLAADEIARLRAENERINRPWWRRLFARKAA